MTDALLTLYSMFISESHWKFYFIICVNVFIFCFRKTCPLSICQNLCNCRNSRFDSVEKFTM